MMIWDDEGESYRVGADKNKSFQLANDGLIIARMIALGAGEKEKKLHR